MGIKYLYVQFLIIFLWGCTAPKSSVSFEKIALQASDTTKFGEVEIKREVLEEMYHTILREPQFKTAYSLLVVKDGILVSEGYFNDYKIDQRQNVKSVTKSILSLLLGMAIDQGHISGVDLTAGELFPAYFSKGDSLKQKINLHHMLTMQTGLKWYENMEWFFNISWHPNWMFKSKNTVKYVLGIDTEDVPGGHFHYSTGASQLIAGALKERTGKPVLEFAKDNLFHPLGINEAIWELGKDGIHYGGVGLQLTPREMALIGQFCLQKGKWNGNQLLSESWVERATSELIKLDDKSYGYHWWVGPIGYSAQGYGGQYIYVVPEHNLVVVFTAKNNKPKYVSPAQVEKLISKYVIKALR
jgi:CubicO group peptidase (beta-lactamase class C family)